MGFSMWSIATQPANVAQLPFFRRSSRRVQTRSRGCCVAWPRLLGRLSKPDSWWDVRYKNLLQKPVEYLDISTIECLGHLTQTCLQKDLLQETSSIELQDDFDEYNDWTYLFSRICHILHHAAKLKCRMDQMMFSLPKPKKNTTSIPCVDTSFLALSGNIPPNPLRLNLIIHDPHQILG